MTTTGNVELPRELLQRAVHVSHGRTQQEVVVEALQEYIRHHEDEQHPRCCHRGWHRSADQQ